MSHVTHFCFFFTCFAAQCLTDLFITLGWKDGGDDTSRHWRLVIDCSFDSTQRCTQPAEAGAVGPTWRRPIPPWRRTYLIAFVAPSRSNPFWACTASCANFSVSNPLTFPNSTPNSRCVFIRYSWIPSSLTSIIIIVVVSSFASFFFVQAKLRSWKAQALWSKFDKRAAHRCYNRGKPCANTRVSPCIFPIHTAKSIQAYPNCDRPDGRSRTNGSTVCRRPAQTPL